MRQSFAADGVHMFENGRDERPARPICRPDGGARASRFTGGP
jgi:hypothetical protein